MELFWQFIGKGVVVGGIVVVILRLIFAFMLKWRDKKNGNGKIQSGTFGSPEYYEKVKKAISELNQLWEWHKPDDSGVQQWKNPGFARDIKSVEEELKDQTKLINEICNAVKLGADQINDVHQKILKL